MKYFLLFLIRIYQLLLRPIMPTSCVFTPSCSVYGYEAIERFGAYQGTLLTLKRLARCHPLQTKKYDPVPEKNSTKAK